MAFTYGFYNSKGGDRKYNADQMGNLFDGILNDGVFDNVGNIFATVPGEGLQVLVKSGRAWFNKTWSYNDAAYPIYLERPDVAVPRIDAIVLEVDRRETHRRNRIGYVKGVPSSIPTKPTLTNTDLIRQYPLSYVTVRAGISSINSTDIEIRVGQSDCPFVTGILQTANIDDLFAAWNEQFTTWFEGVKSQLEGDVAGNLLREIQLRVPIADKSTKENSEALKDDTKWMTPLQTKYAVEKNPRLGKLTAEDGTVYKFKDYLTYYTASIAVRNETSVLGSDRARKYYYRSKLSPDKSFLATIASSTNDASAEMYLRIYVIKNNVYQNIDTISTDLPSTLAGATSGKYESNVISYFVSNNAIAILLTPSKNAISSSVSGVYMYYVRLNREGDSIGFNRDSVISKTIGFADAFKLELTDYIYDAFSAPINRRYVFAVVSTNYQQSSGVITPSLIRVDMETGFTATTPLGVLYNHIKYTRIIHSDENTVVVFTACDTDAGGSTNDYSIIIFDATTLSIKFKKSVVYNSSADADKVATMLYCISVSGNEVVVFLHHKTKPFVNAYRINVSESTMTLIRENNNGVPTYTMNSNFLFDSPIDSKTPDKSKIVCIYAPNSSVDIGGYHFDTCVAEFNIDGSVKSINYDGQYDANSGSYMLFNTLGTNRTVVQSNATLRLRNSSAGSIGNGPIIPDFIYPLKGIPPYIKFGTESILVGSNTVIPLLEKYKGDETI